MSDLLNAKGYHFHRRVFEDSEIERYRDETERLSAESGKNCLRGVRQRSSIFNKLTTDSRLFDLLPEKMIPVRTILFDKTAEQNWPVLWHRDLTIAVKKRVDLPGYRPWSLKEGVPHVQPPMDILEGMITARIHLDDANGENGALRIIPGSHLKDKLENEEEAMTCDAVAGDVLLMRPLIWHSSGRSQKAGHRRIVHIEYTDPDSLDPALNWYENADRL